MQGLSALWESMLQCTQLRFLPSSLICSHGPRLHSRSALQHRGVHAWHVQFMACLGYYCAHPAPLVVQLRLLPPRTSNARVCLIIIRCRHCARLSFIVLHRMLFVDQYFRRASGSRGSGRCLHMAWAWPERGKRRGRPGKAGEASFGRALPALRWAMHCMCSLERNFECTGGPWRPRLGSFALLASL